MAARIQSPSSINTYKQCPRKYYYQYIAKLETKPNIHLLRGGIVHSVLEDFFTLPKVPEIDYSTYFQHHSLSLLKKHWNSNIIALSQVASDEALSFYLHESQMMIVNWMGLFTRRLEREMKKGLSAQESFLKLTPKVEQEIVSPVYRVRGFIDAIETHDDGIRIMDYKTSKSAEITEAYRLQLAIYALLFEERHGSRPNKVGIYFLNSSERMLDVTDELIKLAKMEIELVHKATERDELEQYPKQPTRLCKWSTGQCDFFEQCFKSDSEYRSALLSIRNM